MATVANSLFDGTLESPCHCSLQTASSPLRHGHGPNPKLSPAAVIREIVPTWARAPAPMIDGNDRRDDLARKDAAKRLPMSSRSGARPGAKWMVEDRPGR